VKAAWYEKQGGARDVLTVGEMDDPQPRAGEVRIRVAFSGINPGDVKNVRMLLPSACPIRVLFRTAMAQARWMQ
jgi:NADPH:quinone reductase